MDFPGEDNIQPYIQKILDIDEVLDFDYAPSVEDFLITAFKAKLLDSYFEDLKPAMTKDGLLADSSCTIYLPIGQLASICDGKTRLYIDGNLIKEFNAENQMGKSYLLLSEELTTRIMEYVSNPTWFPDSIRGKRIYIHFYMTEDDWFGAVTDKDPFKYLRLDVHIESDKQ